MMTLKIGEKELKVKFGYEATLKTRLLSRIASMEKAKKEGMEGAEDLLLFLPEFLLVGLQKYHAEEYGYDYATGEGKEERTEEMFGLIDDYFDENEKADALTLYNDLMEEMQQNGFLKSQFQKELEKNQPSDKVVQIAEKTEN